MEAAEQQCNESCDQLSDLPDTIIHHILSFLPIKDVIRTSFLSRRWRYLWTSVPSLDFDGLVFSPKIKFMKFVDSVLLRCGALVLNKFHLRFGGYYCNIAHVHSWIHTALVRNVQELGVFCYTEEQIELPNYLFTCKSLIVLRFNLFNLMQSLPSSIYLPYLKILHLNSATFKEDNLTGKLLSNCPLLEHLTLEDLVLQDLNVLHISSSSLRRLTINGIRNESGFSNDHDLFSCNVKVSAPQLLSLKYFEYIAPNLSLENVPSLVDASINFGFNWGTCKRACSCLCSFLKDLSIAEALTLYSTSIQFLPGQSNLLEQLPDFYNLKQLKLTLAAKNDNIQAITYILHRAPNLEFLYVDFTHVRLFDASDYCEPQYIKFEEMIYHLKIVKIRGFRGGEAELMFVKSVLENSRDLERISIVPSKEPPVKSELLKKIIQEILMHERASKSGEVLFL